MLLKLPLSLKKIFWFLLSISFVVQTLIISYNHFTGYVILNSFQSFLMRIFYSSILSLLASFMLTIPNLIFINYLNKIAPWSSKKIKRVFLHFGFSVGVSSFVAISVTLISNSISAYSDNLKNVIINNILISNVLNIILISTMEAWIFYIESLNASKEAEKLKEELIQIKFEVLKNQINPHFLFNSLNVLSGLINKDIIKAQVFIDEFSNIYRYVLETIDQSVISLEKEIDFARSYLVLQQIRLGESLKYEINIPAFQLEKYIPPLSLQILLENAIKHNISNDSKPLYIDIFCENDFLIVKNNFQPKVSSPISTKLGLKNITKRYSMLLKKQPEFNIKSNYFIAKLPLIE